MNTSNPYELSSLSSEQLLKEAPANFPRRALFASLMVMLPWPLLGIVACWRMSLFEESNEAVFMFGSVTMILLLPLAFVFSSESIFSALIGAVWLFALISPLCIGKKSFHPRFHVQIVLVLQSLFSAIQAGFGFLVVLGKYC